MQKIVVKLAETIQSFERGSENCHRPEDRKLASDYLSALAPLLAKAVLGQDILQDISSIERLFGNTWIVDAKPFEEAFTNWADFKRQYEERALK